MAVDGGAARAVAGQAPAPRADVLPLAVPVALAAGEDRAAEELAAELHRTAELAGAPSLTAAAEAAGASLVPAGGAVALLTRAVGRLGAAGLPWDEARARVSLAEALLATGDAAAARHHLELATGVLSELRASEDLARARRLARAAGAASPAALTPREREVLALVARGLSNHEVAVELVLSEHTVHRHVANILVKLDQTSRTGAVSCAIQAGLLGGLAPRSGGVLLRERGRADAAAAGVVAGGRTRRGGRATRRCRGRAGLLASARRS